MATTGKSLYFHIPFCKKKCPYCHFYVIGEDETKKDLLLDAFLKECQLLNISPQDPLVSIYLGGGTPYLLGAARVAYLLNYLSKHYTLSPTCEITLEANPCDITLDGVRAFKQAGVNRFSLGVQSLHDPSLIGIGRQHSAHRALQAIEETYTAGISNISIDLMYDRPHQTLESWAIELNVIKDLPITHLSLYNLTIEEGSAYKRNEKKIKAQMPDPELSFCLHIAALSALEEAGFERYEISAFAKNGAKSIHNLGYWQGRPFYGLGPSAFSYIEGTRRQNVAHFAYYIEKISEGSLAHDFHETLERSASEKERLAIALRVTEGVPYSCSWPQETLLAIEELLHKGYLQRTSTHLQLTPQGQLFYDEVGAALI